MPGKNDDIVFEDLRGRPDFATAEVDLDADKEGVRFLPPSDDDDDDKPTRGRAREDDDDDDDSDLDDEDDHDRGTRGRARVDDDEEEDDADEEEERPRSNVRKRIDRERRLARAERERAEAAEAELAELRKNGGKERVERIKSERASVKTQLESAQSRLEAAIEAGKSSDQAKIMAEISGLQARAAVLESDEQRAQEDANAVAKSPTRGTRATPSKNPLVERWKARNSDWYQRKGFERATRIANRIDEDLTDEGYDPSDPEYFKRLDRRMRKEMPELFDDADAPRRRGRDRDDDDDTRRRRGSPVGRVGNESRRDRDTGDSRVRGGKVRLGEADFANMRNFNLDPRNPEHVKEYADNVRQTEAQHVGRRRGAA